MRPPAIVLSNLLATLFATFALLAPQVAHCADRVALVIGNSNYRGVAQLANPKNDATDIAATLRKLGFEVVQGLDLSRVGMEDTIRTFIGKLRGAKVAVFFYAGHDLQVDNVNYLVPIDAKIDTTSDLSFAAVSLDYVLRQMDAQQRVNLIFLDACRDNPLAQTMDRKLATRQASVGRGLASIKGSIDTLIAFSTEPDKTALDGEGRNSPFTTALLKHIQTPGLEIGGVLRRVRTDVVAATKEEQIPWDHSSLRSDVVLLQDKAAGGGSLVEQLARDGARATEALTEFGRMDFFGHGGPQSFAKALQTFEKAAKEGDPSAIKNLGFMYQVGRGVKVDYARALQYYAMAPDHPVIVNNLGVLYSLGLGVPKDELKAARLFEQAMLGGDDSAPGNLGSMYENSEGVPKDLAKARILYEVGATYDDQTAQQGLARLKAAR